MGLGLLLLLKLPVILFTFFGKFLLFFKVAKVLKLLALPLLLVGLLPLLLVPLLLLAPLLLPLLLALPIPVLQPAAAAAGRRRRDTRRLMLLQGLLESERCLERVACTLAADKQPVYTTSIAWGLDLLKSHIAHPKMKSYAEAYREAAEKKLSKGDCVTKYPCQQQQQPSTKSNRTKRISNAKKTEFNAN
ncbi:hypothetical protein GE061_004049 [Apolygus lucorum]|uniref:Uncharacterized protein n=1 Tax=Apolygus lucorum TaxID=248454 RepID=A0A8S9X0S1_APOLU|nr:hypothetical protein GE061_004049 [Apolygus lucorum]